MMPAFLAPLATDGKRDVRPTVGKSARSPRRQVSSPRSGTTLARPFHGAPRDHGLTLG
jgi:hypothetical protein